MLCFRIIGSTGSTPVVLPGEDPAEYQALASEYDLSLRPGTPAERFYAELRVFDAFGGCSSRY